MGSSSSGRSNNRVPITGYLYKGRLITSVYIYINIFKFSITHYTLEPRTTMHKSRRDRISLSADIALPRAA